MDASSPRYSFLSLASVPWKRPLRVMIVEDMQTAREALKNGCQHMAYRYRCYPKAGYGSPRVLLEKLQEYPVDVVILDISWTMLGEEEGGVVVARAISGWADANKPLVIVHSDIPISWRTLPELGFPSNQGWLCHVEKLDLFGIFTAICTSPWLAPLRGKEARELEEALDAEFANKIRHSQEPA